MKICIPVEDNRGLDSKVCAHFGSAPYFIIYDTSSADFETINNSDQAHSHGMCQPLTLFKGKNIDIVICGGMGARAVTKMNEAKIKVFRIDKAECVVSDLLKSFSHSELKEITIEDACQNHDCH